MTSERLDSLPAIEAALWRELLAAPQDALHPWRTPVLATTDGELGDARTVMPVSYTHLTLPTNREV